MLECVINVSTVAPLDAGDSHILDVHRDAFHNRSVLTMAGPRLWDAVQEVTRSAVARLDIRTHAGVHPRIGVVDVVPWIDLDDPFAAWTPASLSARDRYAAWAEDELGVPTYVYGPERTLPDIRRDPGLRRHRTAGAIAVGARGVLVAYNLWLSGGDVTVATRVAATIRRPGLRTLGLQVGAGAQVSCNLVDPSRLGPDAVYDLVAEHAAIERAELVGLLPRRILDNVPRRRWEQLDLSADRTIEHYL